MDCKWAQSKLLDLANDQLQDREKSSLVQHMVQCNECRTSYEELIKTLSDFEAMPLEISSLEFKDRVKTKIQSELILSPMQKPYWYSSLLKIAASILLILAGGLLGYLITSNRNNSSEINFLKAEIISMKQQESLAVLEEQTPSKKLQAISTLKMNTTLDEHKFSALFNCLVSDENPNVRLAAVKALSNFKDMEPVKLMLIESLEYQTDPVVQIYLINTLSDFELQEAFRAIQSFMNSENVNPQIKEYSKSVLYQSNI